MVQLAQIETLDNGNTSWRSGQEEPPRAAPGTFNVTQSDHHGFIRIAANQQHLKHDDGTLVPAAWACGIATATGQFNAGQITEEGLDGLKRWACCSSALTTTPLETMGTRGSAATTRTAAAGSTNSSNGASSRHSHQLEHLVSLVYLWALPLLPAGGDSHRRRDKVQSCPAFRGIRSPAPLRQGATAGQATFALKRYGWAGHLRQGATAGQAFLRGFR